MSDDITYPVFRTPDPVFALRVARRLVQVGCHEDSWVSVCAYLDSVAEVQRVARAFPQGGFQGTSGDDEGAGVRREEDLPPLFYPVRGSDVPADPAGYEGRLPVECALNGVPVGSVEDAFLAAIGTNRGEINWSGLWWPDAPQAGLHGESKHAEVTLLLNTPTRDVDEQADDHTVLVHVLGSLDADGRQRREPYAHWLAEQVGLTVLGPWQHW
ncbi:hypothetical protein [Streptomyces sp. NPDC047014]|uniref:hypothetical protein n=1 Tax=Streptomyces sp. NPDC047014 TaxID=3155736 RepID=UPI0034009A9F